jgi:hypothetical protein
MRKSLRWSVILLAAAIVLPIPTFVAWQSWRDHKLRGFCREVRVGLPVADLMSLERRYGIDASYLVLFKDDDFEHQAQKPDLTFRSYMLDPDLECAISQNGITVTSADLVPE